MIKKITKEIEKLELQKDKKEKEKTALINELSDIDTKLKKLKALKKQCENLEKSISDVFNPTVSPQSQDKQMEANSDNL